jgi:preprotein translocase subunit SecA
MLAYLREHVTSVLCHVELRVTRPEEELAPRPVMGMIESREDPVAEPAERGNGSAALAATAVAASPWSRTPRNAPCPCGSGKKYKHCHGRG